ncbi:hypothetical protein R6Q57_029655 [Mikania cordata]
MKQVRPNESSIGEWIEIWRMSWPAKETVEGRHSAVEEGVFIRWSQSAKGMGDSAKVEVIPSAGRSCSQPDNEAVPETQDTQKRKKGKKNKQPAGTGPSSGPMAPKQWTHDEEIALGRCYMDESENKTKGNSQKRENFWKKVTVTWHNVMGFDAEYRTYHQLNSKWKDMCTKLTKFSGIYSNCANNRKNGMNDDNVLKWAKKEYQLKTLFELFDPLSQLCSYPPIYTSR